MALSREEVNRRLADAAAAQRGQVHQLGVDTRLSDEQLDELSTVEARGRRDRARELVALEGRAVDTCLLLSSSTVIRDGATT